MKRFAYKTAFLLACMVGLFSSCNTVPSSNTLTIATAANMQFAMQVLTKAFTAKTGIHCDVVISSSGKLTAQIKEGAPYDVFVSADMKYPNELFNSGLTANTPKVYALGRLVLWSMVEGLNPTLEGLKNGQIQHIALANIKTAPYGIAAMKILEHHQLLEELEEKLVYGESIAQTNQFITSKSAEVGFTALSVVLSPPMKNKGQWMVLEEGYAPIEQGVVLVKRKDGNGNQAQQFYDFLFSEEAKRLLKDFGYLVDE